VVAEGAAFSDGGAVVRWLTGTRSTVVWDHVEDVHKIHGHGGATRIVWVDPPGEDGQLHPQVTASPSRV
jgi:hypothetical protein